MHIISVINALKFSGVWEGVKLDIDYINTKDFDKSGVKLTILKNMMLLLYPVDLVHLVFQEN